VPQLICGSAAEREEFFNRKYDELTKLTGEDNVLLCDSQALFDEFLNALSNATVKEWRECLLSKKYILIDEFHWFETKNIMLDELTYIFKHTNATIILGVSKLAGEYDFGEAMNQFVSTGG
jgi:chromosomal replication initiation ATPase DnaA